MEQIFQRLAPSCAMVLTRNASGKGVDFLGSAFAVREDGYLFTAAEVVKDRTSLLVSPAEDALGFQSSSREQLRCFAAEVKAADAGNNVALLKIIDPVSLRLLPDLLGETETLHPGAAMMQLGFPFGRHGTLVLTARTGHLAAKMLSTDGRRQLLVEGAVYSGAAGGALVDLRRGRIVGVLGSQLALLPKDSESAGKFTLPLQTDLSLAAPIEAATALLPRDR
ncbi:MAG TPA: serine protease [Gammaproteobacteria bacterium]|nr:serine protease [Gammaproteobacteria bacterium]